ncbi:copper resistance protein CopC [Cellulomonas flavigena DSM 20109]|uniref:Copper resistance protein CopC n=1 Tax=Cellulomonas flavigena (strain ATCC 482 / DSM 20109 / BCRC 11376 / JCM 18109 / NBRC 3775 / NCIMB 8073 / NRS 134) TaxID=446466 RepID=D5UCM2_CELFN|nr:copper resistance CopC family protein [Cellulomonas flavigena]ADG76257.1 copper resistance protein CopC [Cellulomonas flavigena DSM 20109]
MPSVVPSVGPRAARRVGALAALVLLLAVLGASPASAHNTLRSSDPADGATVATVPPQVTLTFDQEALDLGTQVVVTGPDGVVVSDGPVQLVDTSVVQPLVATLPAGAYTVEWRVTSADGHPLSGALTFTASEAAGAVAAPAPDVPAEDPAAGPTEAATTAAGPSPDATATADAPVVDGDDLGGAADDVVTTAGPAISQEGVSPGVWIAVAMGTLAAVGGGVAAMVATQRRADAADRAGGDRTAAAAGSAPGGTAADGPGVAGSSGDGADGHPAGGADGGTSTSD